MRTATLVEGGSFKKVLLRSILDIGGAITQANLGFNFKKLEEANIDWRPDDQKIYDFAHHWWKTEGEAPQIASLYDHFERLDDIEVTERLKDVEATKDFYIRTNFSYAIKQEQDTDNRIKLVATLKEAHDIINGREGHWKHKTFSERAKGALDLFTEKAAALTDGGGKKDAKKIAHVGFDEILKPLGPVPWVCEGLRMAPGGGIYMLGGYGFSAKTMVLQHMELCIASGLSIFGIHAVTQGRVLHIDYEQGKRLTYERFQRLAREMGLDFETLIKEDRLRLAVFPDLSLDAEDAEEVLKATMDEGFDFLGVDPFRAACPTTDENSSMARQPLDMINRVCGDKRLGMVLHHSNKPPADGNGRAKRFSIRGSSAIFDALAGAFVLTKDSEEKDSPIVVTHEKEKWRGVLLPDFGVRVVDAEGEGRPDWGVRVESLDEKALAALEEETGGKACDEAGQKIVAYMTNLGGCAFEGNRTELCKAAGVKKSNGLKAITTMMATKKLRAEGKRITLCDERKEAEELLEALQ